VTVLKLFRRHVLFFSSPESRKTLKESDSTNKKLCTLLHLHVYPTFRAFGIPKTFSSLGIVHVANKIPATKLYFCTCRYKMRYDRLSDKIEERHRSGNVISSGYRREKS
jgi:hypothetical protein